MKNVCTCNSYVGIFCGHSKKSGFLKGDCNPDLIYRCSSSDGAPADMIGVCSHCKQGRFPGRDYCAIAWKIQINDEFESN